ncbi:hypothetical protein BDV95DRAFT_570464 [Massariosphaeria phaeospora]|uniref:Secreted protein n=1 Tax=Massariosphaeria phaeospora TaxID=100035 RepID=A0A7C8I7M3_9PLEO|nr:hypothetical protein BDV95DRAFT_570464 [Massariosphaeria phaeospora]
MNGVWLAVFLFFTLSSPLSRILKLYELRVHGALELGLFEMHRMWTIWGRREKRGTTKHTWKLQYGCVCRWLPLEKGPGHSTYGALELDLSGMHKVTMTWGS